MLAFGVQSKSTPETVKYVTLAVSGVVQLVYACSLALGALSVGSLMLAGRRYLSTELGNLGGSSDAPGFQD
ncbi:MAG TPA: hypothetical protein DEF45_03240 [Rhodopirellula sp.]|nr:hypothetical protein [Rhodopirellula sp.]